MSDAFGGRGGIAQHNRHLLEALCADPAVTRVLALPRVVHEAPSTLPARLHFVANAAGSKSRYLAQLSRVALAPRTGPLDVVISGHLNLLPLAALAARRHRAPLLQVVHGVEAWQDPGPLRRNLLRQVDLLVSVSEFTRRKVLAWAALDASRTMVIPNAIDLTRYTPGAKRIDLQQRYGLAGRRVILTLARLSRTERYKGHDEILDALPEVLRQVPDAVYLVAGDGDDRPRLQARATALGLGQSVVFTGYVPEADKLGFLRLADVFAMPGRGEGFGIVYLEAIACGVPVIASAADAGAEALLGGSLGRIVDPASREDLSQALAGALLQPALPERSALSRYDVPRFRARWRTALQAALSRCATMVPDAALDAAHTGE